MRCPIAKVSGKTANCDEDHCGWWDRKKEQCGILSYMQAYYAMGLATLKMTETTERIEREYGEAEDAE